MTFQIPAFAGVAARLAARVASRAAAATVLGLATVGTAGAQQAPVVAAPAGRGAPLRLSIDDALRLAQDRSQTVEIARAGVTRATGQRLQARAQYLPQLSGTAGYTKTLQSQFSSFSTAAATPESTVVVPTTGTLCAPIIPANAGADQRAAALAQAATCPSTSSGAGGFNLSNTSFGATNQYVFGLNFSQNLFTGGRIAAQNQAADAGFRSATIEVTAQRAQASLDVASAYYDALLTDQLVAIADSSLAETTALLEQTRVGKQVGNASEFELLRAQVTRDNQLPVLLQAQSNRDVAYLRLKQLLDLALDSPLQLTTSIDASAPTLPAAFGGLTPDTLTGDRAAVRESNEAVVVQQAQVRIARAERIPAFALTSAYQRLYFPSQVVPSLANGVNNWTVGVSTSLPILDGGRIRGDLAIAQAGLQQASAQREQTRQYAALDARVALTTLQQAQSTWDASRGTAEQAQRAYDIDQVRFREGISTQTDLAQSRLLLEQARANRAQAARNLAVAHIRLALLRDLPIQSGSTTSSQSAQQSQTQTQSQQQSTSTTQGTSTSTSTSSSPATSGGSTGSGTP